MKVKSINVNLDLDIFLFNKLQIIEKIIRNIEGEDYNMVITSANDGKHMTNSLHYEGMAVDIRNRDMKNVREVVRRIKLALGNNYDVVNEKDHIHIELDYHRNNK